MIYLLMADHTYVEVPEATTARVEGDQVVCRTREGNIISMIEAVSVAAYGSNEALRNPLTVGAEMAQRV